MGLSTPVALFIFNRPDLTRIVFQSIRSAKPKKLFVIADGPRFSEEWELCAQSRAVVDQVDWTCEVVTSFSDRNLGCDPRVSSGLGWVFSQVEDAIVLEDDCLPHPSFYTYCEELLERFRNIERIRHIAGLNLVPFNRRGESFRYSRLFPSAGGWATWRRAWQHYDPSLSHWPEYLNSGEMEYFGGYSDYIYQSFKGLYSGARSNWDGVWGFACTIADGLSVIPRDNMIRNLGFRPDATHTVDSHWLASLSAKGVDFPLAEPNDMVPDRDLDQQYLGLLSGAIAWKPTLLQRAIRKISREARRFQKHSTLLVTV